MNFINQNTVALLLTFAYGGCARSTISSHNLAVLPKRHDNYIAFFFEDDEN